MASFGFFVFMTIRSSFFIAWAIFFEYRSNTVLPINCSLVVWSAFAKAWFASFIFPFLFL